MIKFLDTRNKNYKRRLINFLEIRRSGKNIDQLNKDLALELLTIDIFKKEDIYEILLLFSKNRIITLSTEVIDVTLEDQKINND